MIEVAMLADLIEYGPDEEFGPERLEVLDAERFFGEAVAAQSVIEDDAPFEMRVELPGCGSRMDEVTIDLLRVVGKPFPQESDKLLALQFRKMFARPEFFSQGQPPALRDPDLNHRIRATDV
jgi:hypothetical protein